MTVYFRVSEEVATVGLSVYVVGVYFFLHLVFECV